MLSKIFILYASIIWPLTISNKLSPDRHKNPDECARCKIVTDSFRHWLEQTSRGKFEGGDTAWEEAKLKTYSTSEIRLVEIQEGLCSEVKKHQDQCYSLVEEVEQVLEKWWFLENRNSLDLYTWLCIETIQYCCPKNHFGLSCEPCPLDNKNQICGGHGSCDGDGTRKGNGTCNCNKGYNGLHCEECSKRYFKSDSLCKPCHKACDNCFGDGPSSCHFCRTGWQDSLGECVDINECLSPDICKINEYCVNMEGSYSCKTCDVLCKSCIGVGSNCTACEPPSLLWSGQCVDDALKSTILAETLKRIALYCGLLLITLFVYRTSRSLASFIVLVVAIYIYFSEKSSRNNVHDVILNLYFSN